MVAALNKLPVKEFVVNTLAVPLLVVVILGLAPFKFNEVAFVAVIVALPIVSVPLDPPIPNVVAAPASVAVVGLPNTSDAVNTEVPLM